MAMMRIKDVFKPKGLLAICFMIAIVWFGIPTAKTAWQTLQERKPGDKIQATVQRIHKQCVSRFNRKYDFIDLNGLFCRMCGIRVSNGVRKLDNGHLILTTIVKGEPQAIAKNIIGFSNYLKQRKIPFLYVQVPYKMDMKMDMLPKNLWHYAYEDVNELLPAISQANVDVLDLRHCFADTIEDVERYFYRTDHHWNGDAIFEAFRLVAQSLADRFGISESVIRNEINPSSWRRKTHVNWFLGSWGQRTGRFFGGLDELIWYVPRFETAQFCASVRETTWFKGDFDAAVIRHEYVDSRPDLFTKSAYSVLGGGPRALMLYRNKTAPIKKKCLGIGDSFAYPVWALLSTVFTEIDTIDPRLFDKGTIAEYVVQTKPDMVVQLLNANVFSTPKYFRYGTPEAIRWENSTFVRNVPTQYKVATNGVDSVIVPEIKRGFNYIVEATGFSGTNLPEVVDLSLFNVRSGNVWKRMMFDTEYCNERQKVHWEFSVPEVGYWDLRIIGGESHSVRLLNLRVSELRPGKKH